MSDGGCFRPITATADPPSAEDAPPDKTKPDRDFVPPVGSWFWWKDSSGWCLREQQGDGVYELGGRKNNCETPGTGSWNSTYKGKCLPLDWIGQVE